MKRQPINHQPAPTVQTSASTSGANVDHDRELQQALEAYLEEVELNKKVDRDEFLARYPELADELAAHLEGLDVMLEFDPGDKRSVRATTTLGDFRIIRELGRGGMGIVFEADQLSMRRRVALKVLPFAALLDERQLQRFKNEARAAGTLHHPHVVPVFSVGTERGVHFYAMQYIDGPSLAEVIKDLRIPQPKSEAVHSAQPSLAREATIDWTSGRQLVASDGEDSPSMQRSSETRRDLHAALSTKRSSSTRDYANTVAKWGVQVADALAYAHENGVLHRDIKPGNLLLDSTGKLWVTDFGLARLESDASMTMTGDVVGTLRYMSPEQALAKRVLIDHRTDIYSLGVTLYELATGVPAFRGGNREEILRKIAFEEPVAPKKIDASLPVDLETIILKAASKAPQDRYASAQDLADDLQRLLDHRPIAAKPPTVFDYARKWSRRHTAVVWSAAVVLLLAVVSLASSTYLIGQSLKSEQQQRMRAEENLQMAKEAVDDWYVKFAEEWLEDQDGLSQEQIGFLQKAVDFYQRVLHNDDETAELQFSRARALMRLAKLQAALDQKESSNQHVDLAIEELEQLTANFPAVGRNQLELAEAYLQKAADKPMEHERLSLINGAVDVLRKLARERADDAVPQARLAFAVNSAGMWHHTRGKFEKADVLFEEARVAIESALDKDPDNVAFRHLLAIILRDTAYSYSVNAHQAQKSTEMRLGRRQDGAKLYFRCLGIGRELVESAPENRRYRATLAANLMAAGRFMNSQQSVPLLKESVAQFEIGCRQNPRRADYRSNLAEANRRLYHVLMTLERYDEATEAIQKVVAINDDFPPSHEAEVNERAQPMRDLDCLSDVLEKSERWEECRRATEKLIRLARKWMAEDRFQQHLAPHELFDRLEKACRALGDEEAANEAVVERQKMIDEVINRITRNLDEGRGQTAFMLWQRGWLYHKIGRIQEAIEDYTRILEDMPEHQSAVMNRAILYRERGQYDLYLTETNRAVQIWPHSAICWGNRAWELFYRGRLDEALQDISKALEITGYDEDAYALRANIYQLLGRYEEALADCEAAISGEPSPGVANDARQQLVEVLALGPVGIRDPQRALDLANLLNDDDEAIARQASAYYALEQYDKRASAYYALERYEEARAILQDIVNKGDATSANAMMLSLVLAHMREWQESRRYYHHAIDLLKRHRPFAAVVMARTREQVEQLIPWARFSARSPGRVGAFANAEEMVLLTNSPSYMEFELSPLTGAVADTSVNDSSVHVVHNGRVMEEGKQYRAKWDSARKVLQLEADGGRFPDGVYNIHLSHSEHPIAIDNELVMPSQQFMIKVESSLPAVRSRVVGFIDATNDGSWNWQPSPATRVVIRAGSEWRYLDDGSDQGMLWKSLDFNDADWKQGRAQLGYGDGDEVTEIGFGPNGGNKYVTSYFRTNFEMPDAEHFSLARTDLLCDDGAAIYLNGRELIRDNLAAEADFKTFAISSHEGANFASWYFAANGLYKGRNVVAAEVHQNVAGSSDMSFDLRMTLLESGLLTLDGLPELLQIPAGSTIASARLELSHTSRDSIMRLTPWSDAVQHAAATIHFQSPVSRQDGHSEFDVTELVRNWWPEDSDGKQVEPGRWLVWLDGGEDANAAQPELADDLATLAPRLVIDFVPPQDQAVIAWHLAVFEADSESPMSRASSLAENAIEYDPQNVIAHCALGLSKIRLGQIEGALPPISIAEQLDSDSPEVWLLEGMARFHEGNETEAQQLLEKASEAIRHNHSASPEVQHLGKELGSRLQQPKRDQSDF